MLRSLKGNECAVAWFAVSGCQLRQQFLVDAAEAAVAHNQNVVACLGGGGDAVHKIIKLLADVGFAAQRGKGGGNVPIYAACVAKHLVGRFSGCLLGHLPLCRVSWCWSAVLARR